MSSDLLEKIVKTVYKDKKIMKIIDKMIKLRDADDKKLSGC